MFSVFSSDSTLYALFRGRLATVASISGLRKLLAHMDTGQQLLLIRKISILSKIWCNHWSEGSRACEPKAYVWFYQSQSIFCRFSQFLVCFCSPFLIQRCVCNFITKVVFILKWHVCRIGVHCYTHCWNFIARHNMCSEFTPSAIRLPSSDVHVSRTCWCVVFFSATIRLLSPSGFWLPIFDGSSEISSKSDAIWPIAVTEGRQKQIR